MVAFAVLMGGSVLAGATGDADAAVVLRWVAVGVLMLTVADLILVVGVLGIRALADADRPDRGRSDDEGPDSLKP